jgi:hypothetical protein
MRANEMLAAGDLEGPTASFGTLQVVKNLLNDRPRDDGEAVD